MAGRPRDPDLEVRLLAATWSLLLAEGYDDLSFAKIAVEANAHRSDIYRRWPTKAQLVTAAVAEHQPPMADVDTGSLRGDLRAILDDTEARWSSASAAAIVAWLADLRRDPVAGHAHREMARRGSQPLLTALARAVQRGEIPERVDLTRAAVLAGNLIEGPLMHNHVFLQPRLSSADLDVLAESVLRVLTEQLGEDR
ncbi:MAG TPA: TetR/AcrR family transcriptional regulator [Amycolatopsis sp.]|jgi:AcrR family transcriptional regulator|nr:TetR/AcrR family transcriptional regulator [Amycolatopsis sp.]